jgi:hypothetical protein
MSLSSSEAVADGLGAQLGYREAARLSQHYKEVFFLGHYIGFFAWHLAI